MSVKLTPPLHTTCFEDWAVFADYTEDYGGKFNAGRIRAVADGLKRLERFGDSLLCVKDYWRVYWVGAVPPSIDRRAIWVLPQVAIHEVKKRVREIDQYSYVIRGYCRDYFAEEYRNRQLTLQLYGPYNFSDKIQQYEWFLWKFFKMVGQHAEAIEIGLENWREQVKGICL